jgi:glycosyltransferase involved in cell wall biosynthesis
MRIAIISLGFDPFRQSGLDVSGERLVLALLSEGHQVYVITGGDKNTQEIHDHPNLHFFRSPLGWTNWLRFSYHSALLLKKLNHICNFDVIHFLDVYFAYAFTGQYVASLQHSFRQRLVSLDKHVSNKSFYLKQYIYYYISRKFIEIPSLRRAVGLLAGSQTSRNEFINNYGISPEKVGLTPHGIDTDFFHNKNNVDQLRRSLGIPKMDPILLFVGFITQRKGLNYLIKSLFKIKPTPWLLVIGRWNNPNLRRNVLNLAGPLSDRIIELGNVPDKLMPYYYSLADIYTSCSVMEGFGIPLVEAMSCETPVVAFDSGATTEVVGPGGVVTRFKDISRFAEAISNLLDDRKSLLEAGKIGEYTFNG